MADPPYRAELRGWQRASRTRCMRHSASCARRPGRSDLHRAARSTISISTACWRPTRDRVQHDDSRTGSRRALRHRHFHGDTDRRHANVARMSIATAIGTGPSTSGSSASVDGRRLDHLSAAKPGQGHLAGRARPNRRRTPDVRARHWRRGFPGGRGGDRHCGLSRERHPGWEADRHQ